MNAGRHATLWLVVEVRRQHKVRSAPGVHGRRALAVFVLPWAVLGLAASPASAHASFVAASPAPGTSLPQAPAAVVLRFTEPLVRSLSSIEVVDSSGEPVTSGPTSAIEGEPDGMRRELGLLTPDEYTVRWTTVSVLDGHSLHGSYTFGIGTAAGENEQVAASPVASEGWLGLAGRLVALTGLTLWSGAVVLAGRMVAVGAPWRRLARIAPALALGGTLASVVSSALVATGNPADVVAVLGSRSGMWRGLLLLVAALATVWRAPPRWLAVLLVVVGVTAEAASGHAAATPVPVVATASFAVHLLAVGVWVTALVAALTAAQPLGAALKVFTRPAVTAAVVVGLTGATNAAFELVRPQQLISTAYGQVVVGKTVAFTAMVALGLLHYRRRRAAAATARLRRPVRGELASAGLALVLATVLVGFPNPPREEETVAADQDEALAGLLHESEAVSVAVADADLVVALSVVPPEPGAVELRVDVLGLEPGERLEVVELHAESDAGERLTARLQPCGGACFSAPADVPGAGRWSFTVTAAGEERGIDATAELRLPAPSGADLLDEAIAAMEALASAQVDEELRGRVGAETVVSSRYAFEAPNAMRFAVEGSNSLIVIGDRAYERPAPEGEWSQREWPGEPFSWPDGYYENYWARDAAAVRILGDDELDGTTMTVLGVVRPDVDAWFRLWIADEDGRVHRMEMVAEGHLMQQTYGAFGDAVDIQPPLVGGG